MENELDRLVADREAARRDATRRAELRNAEEAAGQAERGAMRPALLAEIDHAVERLLQRAAGLGVAAANWRQRWPGTYGWPLIDDVAVQSDGTWLQVRWDWVRGNHSWDGHSVARCSPANHPLHDCSDLKHRYSTIMARVADYLVELNGADEVGEIATVSRAYPQVEAFARRHRARIIAIGTDQTAQGPAWKISRTNLFKGPSLWRASLGPDGDLLISPIATSRSE